MSVVKKMTIMGIRSFSPYEKKQQQIEFQTPLTLILGVNGSGKTTIIEALKYAITNKFPPNCTNGSSFVNDPKLTNGTESMGTVRLEIIDAFGNRVFTTRRIKATVKDKFGNLTKKEMDATLKTINVKGEEKEISNKCVDTKTEMIRIMGVSEAILNHVILCHQEDSCWPLDEAKKVKEKFDSIFNTTMYIKCLDQLTKQDKELGQKLKLEQEKFRYVTENLKLARKKKKELEDKGIELAVFTEHVAKYDTDLKEMERKLKELQDLESEHSDVARNVSVTQGKLEMVQKQVQDVKSNIKEELALDIETLRKSVRTFCDENQAKSDKLKLLQQQSRDKQGESQRLATKQQSYLVQEGKYQQEEAENNKCLESMKRMISDVVELVRKLKENSQDEVFSTSMDSCIEMCDADPETLTPETVIRALTIALRARETEIVRTKTQYENEEKEIQKKIDDLRGKKASLETEIAMNKKQAQDNATSVRELKARLQSIEGCNETLALLADDEDKHIQDIDSIQKSNIITKYDAEIKTLGKEIKELNEQLDDASADVDTLSKDKGKLDQIAIFKKQKSEKQNECNDIMRKIEDELTGVLGQIPETNIFKVFEKKRESLIREISVKKTEQKQKERELTVNETEFKRLRSDLLKKEMKVEGFNERIEVLLGDRSFEDVYDEITEKLELKQKDSYYADAGGFLYQKFVRKLQKKDCCPLCKRDTDKKQTAGVLAFVQEEIEKFQRNKPVVSAEIEDLKNKQQELLDLKPAWDEKNVLNEEIPKLKEKQSTFEKKVSELTELMDDINGTLAILENEKATLDKYSKDVGLLDNAKKEIVKRQESIDKVESSRAARAKELQETTNLSDATTKLQELRGSVQRKQLEKDNKATVLNNKRLELNKLQDQKNKVREEILKITAELQNREALEVQKKELEALVKQLQEESKTLAEKLPKAKSEIVDAESTKKTCVDKKDKHLHDLRNEKDSVERQKTKLADVAKRIKDFEAKKPEFQEIQKRSAESKRKLQDVEEQLQAILRDIDCAKTEISTREMKLRNIQDNLDYKQKLEEVKLLKVELAERQKLLASTQTRGVAAEKRELSQKHQALYAKMNQCTGQKREIKETINGLKKELGASPFVNAEKEYVEKLVKKSIYEKTQRDVKRYKMALDQAILKFHTKRMQMINEILHEYWRRIYKGNDIDSIQIRTEATSAAGTVPGAAQTVKLDGKTRKAYNYRVVMIRKGIELDMRGRCSAGQRVLASIIIRIALAESFSTRCGIITLDEPTTNLDQKNINSLADALSGLAEKMSSRNNFQLIVITHDQEFTERLSGVDAVEKYWKVTRDDMGFSQIQMIPKRGH